MNPLRAWNRFWFGPISARPLGVYRILFGLFVLAHLAFISVDLDYWYTDAGLLQGNEARLAAGPLRFSPLLWVQDPVSVRCVVGALAAVAVAFVAGLADQDHERLALPRAALALPPEHLDELRPRPAHDDHQLLHDAQPLRRGVLAGCETGSTSPGNARRAARSSPGPSGSCRSSSASSTSPRPRSSAPGPPGWAARRSITSSSTTRSASSTWSGWRGYPVVINVLTLAGLLVEFALAFLLWFRPSRKWIALAGVMLHAGIVPLVNVPLVRRADDRSVPALPRPG